MYCSPALGKPVADILALHPDPSSAASPINSFHLQNHKPPSPQLARAPKCHPVLAALQVFAVCSHCSFKPGAEDILSFHGVRLLSNQRPPGSSSGHRLARETVQAHLHIGRGAWQARPPSCWSSHAPVPGAGKHLCACWLRCPGEPGQTGTGRPSLL